MVAPAPSRMHRQPGPDRRPAAGREPLLHGVAVLAAVLAAHVVVDVVPLLTPGAPGHLRTLGTAALLLAPFAVAVAALASLRALVVDWRALRWVDRVAHVAAVALAVALPARFAAAGGPDLLAWLS